MLMYFQTYQIFSLSLVSILYIASGPKPSQRFQLRGVSEHSGTLCIPFRGGKTLLRNSFFSPKGFAVVVLEHCIPSSLEAVGKVVTSGLSQGGFLDRHECQAREPQLGSVRSICWQRSGLSRRNKGCSNTPSRPVPCTRRNEYIRRERLIERMLEFRMYSGTRSS